MRESWDATTLNLSSNRRQGSRAKLLTPLGKATVLLFVILVCTGMLILIAINS